jgi:protein phosphatase
MINSSPHLAVGSGSHPGEKREINEDNHAVAAFRIKKSSTPVVLAIVADGIGGHQAGEVASEITVESVISKVRESGLKDPLATLRSGILLAGTSVFGAAQQSSEFFGMGSTVAIALVIGNRLYTSHVGDSRIYLYRQRKFRQVTIDHTWVQEAIEHEIIQPQEALDHPHAHMLQRAIGSPEPPEPDFRMRLSDRETDTVSENNQSLELKPGEKILLCTDGLTDLVKDDEIETALLEQSSDEAVESLISLARARGGHDNITVVVISIPEKPKKSVGLGRRRLFFFSVIMILSFVVVIALATLVSWKMGWIPWPLGTPVPIETPIPLPMPT